MVKTVARGRGWTPDVIGELYLDNVGFQGLVFWYDDVIQENEDLKNK
jgi:hypothetical protein